MDRSWVPRRMLSWSRLNIVSNRLAFSTWATQTLPVIKASTINNSHWNGSKRTFMPSVAIVSVSLCSANQQVQCPWVSISSLRNPVHCFTMPSCKVQVQQRSGLFYLLRSPSFVRRSFSTPSLDTSPNEVHRIGIRLNTTWFRSNVNELFEPWKRNFNVWSPIRSSVSITFGRFGRWNRTMEIRSVTTSFRRSIPSSFPMILNRCSAMEIGNEHRFSWVSIKTKDRTSIFIFPTETWRIIPSRPSTIPPFNRRWRSIFVIFPLFPSNNRRSSEKASCRCTPSGMIWIIPCRMLFSWIWPSVRERESDPNRLGEEPIRVSFRRLSFHVSDDILSGCLCQRESSCLFLLLYITLVCQSLASLDGGTSW